MIPNLAKRVGVRLASTLVAVLGAASAFAQAGGPVEWSARLEPASVRAGESAQIVVQATIQPGWYIYSRDTEGDGPVVTTITLEGGQALVANGDIVGPTPVRKFDPNFEIEVGLYSNRPAFGVPVRVADGATGRRTVVVSVRSQACDDRSCDRPRTVDLTVEFDVEPGPARPERLAAITTLPEQEAQVGSGDTPAAGATGSGGGAGPGAAVDQFATDLQRAQERGLIWYLLFAFAMGLAALATPCVFPMIPITVSFFSKKTGEGGVRRNIGGAAAYCLGIIGTFSLLGLILTSIWGATGAQQLGSNPWVNAFLALLFVALALNLFGLYEIGVPSGLVNRVNVASRTSKVLGPLLMGLAFTLVSFTCTVPFVGTVFAGAAAGGSIWTPLAGMVAFSTAFALPFFFLALFPQYMATLPKSGGWLQNVKIYLGFVELAAAVKFLSNIDLVFQWGLLTHPVFLATWAMIALVAGLHMMGWFRIATESGEVKIGWGRRFVGLASFAGAFYCLAAIQGAPMGELSAFLPPNPYPGREQTMAGRIHWRDDFEGALAEARQTGKPLFVDFTGVTCTNCRAMEKNIFPQPQIAEQFEQMITVKLYTDRDTPSDRANQALQEKLTGTGALPVYVVLSPAGEVVRVFQGSTRDVRAFAEFIRSGRAQVGQIAQN